jgi:hypothetical protein
LLRAKRSPISASKFSAFTHALKPVAKKNLPSRNACTNVDVVPPGHCSVVYVIRSFRESISDLVTRGATAFSANSFSVTALVISNSSIQIDIKKTSRPARKA